MKMYSVYDKAAKAFNPPVVERNIATLIRSLKMVLQNKDHNFSINSQDYSLFELARWNDEDGVVESYSEPRHICELSDLAVDPTMTEQLVKKLQGDDYAFEDSRR